MLKRHKILVTGGTGKTGRAVVQGLLRRGQSVQVAARKPAQDSNADWVRFDWAAPESFEPTLNDIGAVYLVAPPLVVEPVASMQVFIEKALAKGVRRFVLLSSSAIPEGGPATGQVHALLKERAPEWVVLQPSWFMQNFTEGHHADSIRTESKIYSATGGARVAFIDAADIGETAAVCLSEEKARNKALILTGPGSMSYDDVADHISGAANLKIEHVALNQVQLTQRLVSIGMPQDYAAFLASLDAFLAAGSEDRTTDTVELITGFPPRAFAAFASGAADTWN